MAKGKANQLKIREKNSCDKNIEQYKAKSRERPKNFNKLQVGYLLHQNNKSKKFKRF